MPAGTYSASVSYVTTTANFAGTYTLNGAGPTPDAPTTSDVGSPYTYTMSITGVAVNADVQLDAAISWAG